MPDAPREAQASSGSSAASAIPEGQARGDAPPDSAASAVAGSAPRRPWARHPRWWLAGAVVLLSLAVFAGGMVAGWRLFDYTASRRVLPEPSVVTVPAIAAGAAGVTMPDVRGLTEENARQVIADAGITVTLNVTTKPWAGAAGLVVAQSPVFDTSGPAEVTLTLSVVAKVPTTKERTALDVAREVTALGSQVTMRRQYKPGATPGSVLSITPATGSPLPTEVTITEAQAAESRYLSELRALEGGCSAGEVKISGPTYPHGLACREDGTGQSVWLLSRAVDSITGQLGVPDTGDPGARAKVEILVDGAVVLTRTVKYGDPPTAVELTTTGALRLTLRITNTSGLGRTEVALGDVRLVGDGAALRSLEER